MHFLDRIHPERGVGGFTKLSGTVLFYNFVKAAMARTGATKVLDFGAGRGGTLHTEMAWVRQLQDLRQLGAQVCAADIDPVVRQHPASDEQVVLERDGPLPFADESFDVIVSDWTFEHVEKPAEIAAELLRILRPGGYVCARTTNRYGYIKLAASLVPNGLHTKVLESVQPDRKPEDVFPTVYKMNSVSQIRRLFPGWSTARSSPCTGCCRRCSRPRSASSSGSPRALRCRLRLPEGPSSRPCPNRRGSAFPSRRRSTAARCWRVCR